MEMQIKVIKADGSVEAYLHTKVIGTIMKALGSGEGDITTAQRLAEVVTYFLYYNKKSEEVSISEIFSIIKATLSASDYENAAVALSEHHFTRKLKRGRIEVVYVDIHELSDAELLCSEGDGGGDGEGDFAAKSRWDKSRIVADLIETYDMCPQTARTIASMVEEKVLNMGITSVPVSLLKQLVWNDAAMVLRAERQLQMVW